MPKISIFVPIYDTAKYLPRCLDSILNQTLTDIEVILGTDGPQNCDDICAAYAAKDARIKIVFHAGSYGKTFNQALILAAGEYIGIVESDDWCRTDMFERLYTAAKKADADVCKSGFWRVFDDMAKNASILFTSDDAVFNIAEKPDLLSFQPSIWSAIYKTDFLRKNDITMIPECMPFIDAPFHMETLLKADKIASVAEPLYFYYQDNPNQSVKNERASFAGLKAEEYLYDKIPPQTLNDILAAYFFKSTLSRLSWDYGRLTDAENKTEFKAKAAEFFNRLSVSPDRKTVGKQLMRFYNFIMGKVPTLDVEYTNFGQRLFYLKNRDGWKTMNLCGLKFKLYRKGKK